MLIRLGLNGGLYHGKRAMATEGRAFIRRRSGQAPPEGLGFGEDPPQARDVARAVEADEPSEVATHLLDLCEAFHAYHARGSRDPALRVLTEDATVRAARLHLVDAVRVTLAAGLSLLGIAAPEQM